MRCAALVFSLAPLVIPAVASATEPYCVDNPAVIYCNDFEAGTLDGIEAGPRATLVTAASGEPTFEGDGSVLADFSPPYNADAEFGVRFPGVERVYTRFYMRFDDSWDAPMHHFYAIHGDRADNQWSCHGDAGCRPNGELCLSGTTVDTRVVVDGELPGQPFFYTYHPDMNCDPGDSCANYANPQEICDGCAAKGLPCESGLECCWGENIDIDDTSVSLVANTWYAVETMVAANTPGGGDGEMSLWIDGQLVGNRGGIRWRDDPSLLLNHFIVWNYYPETQGPHRVWFDDLVISTEPIGLFGGVGGTEGGGDVGSGGAPEGGGDASGNTADSGASTAGGDGGGISAGASEGGSSGSSAAEGEGGGCGCRSGGAPRLWLWVLPVIGLARRRSRAQGGAADGHRAAARAS